MRTRKDERESPFQEVQLLLLESRIIRDQLFELRSKLNAKAADASCSGPAGPAPSITACRWICRIFQAFRRFRGSGTRRRRGIIFAEFSQRASSGLFLREGSLFPETPIAN